jgi:hypothetical protein
LRAIEGEKGGEGEESVPGLLGLDKSLGGGAGRLVATNDFAALLSLVQLARPATEP